jgi:hypothetical protein
MCLFREGGDGDRDGLARRHWLELGGTDWRWGMRWSWAGLDCKVELGR